MTENSLGKGENVIKSFLKDAIKEADKLYEENKELKARTALQYKLEKENEELKQAYMNLKERHSLLHDVCIDLECDKDGYYQDILYLEKENRELKQLISKTLREQYHMIKNEDKTGALVELKSVAGYLGVDLE